MQWLTNTFLALILIVSLLGTSHAKIICNYIEGMGPRWAEVPDDAEIVAGQHPCTLTPFGVRW